jgi:homogentisate 1,2-dioxygenase
VAPNFVVCSFVPRPIESDEDALKVPFYHQNIDYDEVLFYHNGDFFSRANLHSGMMSFHPAGFPHGPHPKAFEKIKEITFTSEYAVMVDTRHPLKRDPAMDPLELADYWKSWQT